MRSTAWYSAMNFMVKVLTLPAFMLAFAPLALVASDLAFAPEAKIGQHSTNVYVTPANQVLTPAGIQIELPDLRPQALALSPDGKCLAVSGKTPELILLDPKTRAIRQ